MVTRDGLSAVGEGVVVWFVTWVWHGHGLITVSFMVGKLIRCYACAFCGKLLLLVFIHKATIFLLQGKTNLADNVILSFCIIGVSGNN